MKDNVTNFSIGSLVALAFSIAVLVAVFTPWVTSPHVNLLDINVFLQLTAPIATFIRFFVLIAGLGGGIFATWGLFAPHYSLRAAFWAFLAGVLGLIACSWFFVQNNTIVSLGHLGAGFWIGFVASFGLIMQIAIPRPPDRIPVPTYMLIPLRAGNWTWAYVLQPLGQILSFVVLSIVIMSILAVVIGVLLRDSQLPLLKVQPGIDLFNQIVKTLPDMIINGVTIGFLYAVIALGYTMVYGVLQFVNFAHSEIFMVGGVVGYEVMIRLRSASQLKTMSPVLLIALMLISSMIVCGLLAVIVERVAYKPLRRAPRLVPLISAIGVSFFLQDFVRALEAVGRNENKFALPTGDVPFLNQKFQLTATAQVNMTVIVVVVSAIVMLLGLNYFVNATKLGKAIRAVSQDQTTASLMGINVNLMISLTFLIGGALGGAAGVLFSLKVTSIDPYVGFVPGLKAFTAAVLGGIGNITGALLGGILLGLLESFFQSVLAYFPALGTQYTDIFAFAILILILIFRPTGLLGRRVDEKV